MVNTYTNEELINNVDMDMHATVREKTLAMRLAMAIDALSDLEGVEEELNDLRTILGATKAAAA